MWRNDCVTKRLATRPGLSPGHSVTVTFSMWFVLINHTECTAPCSSNTYQKCDRVEKKMVQTSQELFWSLLAVNKLKYFKNTSANHWRKTTLGRTDAIQKLLSEGIFNWLQWWACILVKVKATCKSRAAKFWLQLPPNDTNTKSDYNAHNFQAGWVISYYRGQF